MLERKPKFKSLNWNPIYIVKYSVRLLSQIPLRILRLNEKKSKESIVSHYPLSNEISPRIHTTVSVNDPAGRARIGRTIASPTSTAICQRNPVTVIIKTIAEKALADTNIEYTMNGSVSGGAF